jgi:hypothetical protein
MQPEKVDHKEYYSKLGAKCAKCGFTIECIRVAEQFDFNLGCVTKYLWRHKHKKEQKPRKALKDLQKAQWYLQRAIMKLEAEILQKEFCEEVD